MSTEKVGQKNGHEEKCSAMDCCLLHKLAEMMAKCAEDRKCECFYMMTGGCCPPEEK